MKTLAYLLAALLFSSPAALALTVEEVIDLHKAGLSEETIRAQIEATGATYSLSAEQIKLLKAAGVPEGLIQAMIRTRKAVASARRPAPATDEARRLLETVEGLEHELSRLRGRDYGYYDYGYYGYYGYGYGSLYYFDSGSLFLHRTLPALSSSAFSVTFGSGNTFSGTFSGTLGTPGFTVTPGSTFGGSFAAPAIPSLGGARAPVTAPLTVR